MVDDATRSFDDYDYARALEQTERFFWGFCDDYLELVKQRAYGSLGDDGARSARTALTVALSTLLRLFAPHLPFVTEEVWSWWQEGSVHRAAWPTVEELGVPGEDTSVYTVAAAVLSEIRKAKSNVKRSMRTEVVRATVYVPPHLSQALDARRRRPAARPVGSPATSTLEPGDELRVEVELAEPDPAPDRPADRRHGGAQRSPGLARRPRRPSTRSPGVPSGRTPRRMAPAPLSRMEALVELLGSPQLQYPAIHITGTNGKTSTARMTTALLVSAGLSVGTDTSPYLQRFNERMSWNGEPIPDEELDRILVRLADVEPLLADRPSYFEIINAAAFEWFADIAVDVAVIEVGLGGRWDATNVVDGRVAVVTNVELDHVEYLGPTAGASPRRRPAS